MEIPMRWLELLKESKPWLIVRSFLKLIPYRGSPCSINWRGEGSSPSLISKETLYKLIDISEQSLGPAIIACRSLDAQSLVVHWSHRVGIDFWFWGPHGLTDSSSSIKASKDWRRWLTWSDYAYASSTSEATLVSLESSEVLFLLP